ncbi:MAG: glutamine synthetase III [Proteobacteria bacterium]|nr:glutamine synthetase III [Pseudomonadota bacterium]
MTTTRAVARFDALKTAGSRSTRKFTKSYGNLPSSNLKTSEYFGCNTFGFEQMEKKLTASDVAVLREYATSDKPLTLELANKVADSVREWAQARGATHYCHWFQPQTGATAEKHDAFFSLDRKGNPVERFTGKELIQSEPDASSFPSGGVRATFEARGYTAWDASSPMFLMESENGLTLCIPSLFISYNGDALDEKTPLLRSISALNKSSVEALKLLGHQDTKHVIATAGPEQEYFVVDEALYNLRPDLMLAGRTLLGRNPPRGQQLEDHYFGSIKPRILAFMTEVEHELYKLGVPCKTRHNEVAPSQCEMAPIFENANVAADHNQLVVEVLRTVARRHNLVALFHEKPYAGINGSGKHVNWSVADNVGHNLLEPGDNPFDNIRFLYFLAATIKAVNTHARLLRMSIASAGNDFRLGANEAPPAIISCFLGDTLTEVVTKLTSAGGQSLSERAKQINLDLARVPVIARDNTDRNRTSPFAFTGNKFEFRAVGASASISPSLTYLNAAVADSLNEMNDTLRKSNPKPSNEDILKVIVDTLNEHKRVCFDGNGYGAEWHAEAERRGLPNLRTTPDALKPLKEPLAKTMLEKVGVHKGHEVDARYNVKLERYIKVRMIELETLHEMISNEVIPAAVSHVSVVAKSVTNLKMAIGKAPEALDAQLKTAADLTGQLNEMKDKLGRFIDECSKIHDEPKLADKIALESITLMDSVRKVSDELELHIDDGLWSLPKYRELLYVL